jgi:tRNA(Ile)-lysidine synthase
VLNKVAFEFAKKNIFVSQIGTLVIDLPTFEDELPETKFRILLYSIKWISGNIYGARAKAIEHALQESINGKARTIGGCVIFSIEDKLHIWREYNAVKNLTQLNGIWDGRWSVPKTIETRACGMDGLKNIENWKAIDLPKKALVSMPTIWKNGKVIDYIFSEDKRSSIKLITPRKDFYTGILSY